VVDRGVVTGYVRLEHEPCRGEPPRDPPNGRLGSAVSLYMDAVGRDGELITEDQGQRLQDQGVTSGPEVDLLAVLPRDAALQPEPKMAFTQFGLEPPLLRGPVSAGRPDIVRVGPSAALAAEPDERTVEHRVRTQAMRQ
jgi:hypothetical protein